MIDNQVDNFDQRDDSFSLIEFWNIFLGNWKWFLISVVACVGLATLYCMRIEPTYKQSASVMIKEDGKGGSSAMDVASAFSDMGLGTAKSDVNNEVEVFKSIDVIYETIKRLNLDVKYATNGGFHRNTLYGTSCPIIASMSSVKDDESCTFEVDIKDNGTLQISDMKYNKEESSDVYTGKFGQPIKTIAGNVVILKSSMASKSSGSVTKIYVTKLTAETAIAGAVASLDVQTNNKQNSVIDVSYTDVDENCAKDFINTLIAVYNEHWVEDKNQIAVSTSKFINERLRVIESELGNVDADISSYKSANMVPDVAAAGAMYMQESSEATQNLMALNNQMYMAKTIRSGITPSSDVNSFRLLPANSGIENSGVEKQIDEFNKMLLQRNNYVANSSTENPFVKDLDAKLVAMRQAIAQSLDYVVTSLNSQIKSLKGYNARALSGIQANPTQAKSLLSVERQQKVKESLYLFLLQKREENELNQAFTAYNTRIVSTPHGSSIPVAPQRGKILMMAFVIGFAIPAGVIYGINLMNTKVRGRKDIDATLTMPMLGEVPDVSPKRNFWEKAPAHAKQSIVVESGSQNVINEAFRILRTNMKFVIEKDKKNVVAVTSYNPGSGKSFISLNLATSFSIDKQRVLVIDADLRHASVSKAIGFDNIGMSHYLSGQVDSIDSVVKYSEKLGLWYLPVGAIPPNPTELLHGERFAELLEKVRTEYDLILIDCPPVNVVADTTIIDQFADVTMFVIRAGLFERSMLPVLENDYRNGKLKNLMLVLNGTGTGSGYRYGYGYGYGYYGKRGGTDYYSKN